jgi:hypothetical protein
VGRQIGAHEHDANRLSCAWRIQHNACVDCDSAGIACVAPSWREAPLLCEEVKNVCATA